MSSKQVRHRLTDMSPITYEDVRKLLTDALNPRADPNPQNVSVYKKSASQLVVLWGTAKLMAPGDRGPRAMELEITNGQAEELLRLGASDHRSDPP